MDIKLELKKLFRLLGVEIKLYNFLNAEEPLLKKITTDYRIQTIIDVGANEGQYAASLLKNGFKGTIYSFEPISQPFEILRRRAEKNDQWVVTQAAIGSKDEMRVINVSENIVSSSLYEVGEVSLAAEPTTKIVRQEPIKVTTLDNFFKGEKKLKRGTMLKLDVQGYELEALRGALENLKTIEILQVELSFVPLYEGAPLFIEIASFLRQNGFDLFTFIPGFKDRKTGRLLQADGFFIRNGVNPVSRAQK